jgi:hypothetical protein
MGGRARSFTAVSNVGDVKVQMPDDEPPIVRHAGRVIAYGVPKAVAGPSLLFRLTADPEEVITVTPSGQAEIRKAKSIRRTPDAEPAVDVNVHHVRGAFVADGFPVLWGARVDERAGTVRGYTFEDGIQQVESWEVDLVPVRRKCCGQK